MAAEENPLRTASHDYAPSERLLALMRERWAEPAPTQVEPLANAPHHARRRAALAARLPGETLVVPTGGLVTRNNDCEYPFRPGSDFVWLTGYHEPDAVAVIGPDGEATLYTRPRTEKSSTNYFRDRTSELWLGPRPSLAEVEGLLGIACASLSDLDKVLADLDPARTRVLRGYDAKVDAAVSPGDAGSDTEGQRDGELAAVLSELRLVKDEWEIAQLEEAMAATALGFADVVRAMPADRESPERLVDGVFGLRARHDGNQVGYGTIAAAGEHACTLHWGRNDGTCRPGELLLLDAGVETVHLYTADITRTMPVSGRFTPAQRRIYDLVLAAQEAGIAAVRPGVKWRDINRACATVLAHGLADLGILPVSPEESLQADCGLHRRWTLHAAGHMLGLDVHDCAKARAETYLDGRLAEGHVLTVEPGLYFQPDDLMVPEEYRGIGIRIEDDVLVTENGCRVLSDALPREAAEVERWMADLRAEEPRLPG